MGFEYQGAFHRLLQSVGIDHRYITPGHPESNGAVERTNGAIKKALRKYIQDQSVLDWCRPGGADQPGHRTVDEVTDSEDRFS